MTAVEVAGADRAAWLAARRQGIGGSDAAAVVGLHPWVSPLALYFDKTGEVDGDQEPTEQMEWGLRLEPAVAQAWQEKIGNPNHLSLMRFEPYSDAARRVHPEIPWMYASLDGIVCWTMSETVVAWRGREAGGFEAKTASGWAEHDWEEGVPPYVQVQCQHQMAVTGHPITHGAVLLGGQKFVPWSVERDDATIAGLIDAERVFWQRVQDGRPPRADSKPSTGQVLKARWEETLDEAVELGAEGLELVVQRHRGYRAKKAAEAEQEEAENRLRQLLGENEVGLVFGEIAATWRPDRNGNRRLIVKEIA